MRVALPVLVALAALVAAAPVPQPKNSELFGHLGVLSGEDLDGLACGDPFAPGPTVGGNDKPLVNVVRGRTAALGPPPGRPTALAVHVPKTLFRPGEPIPAYFVVRNGTGRELELDLRLDLTGDHFGTRNGCAIDLRCRSGETPAARVLHCETKCGGGPLVVVKEHGYYVACGDLSRWGGGLPAGEYEVSWQYNCGDKPARSNVARFRVAGGDATPVKRQTLRVFEVTEYGEDAEERQQQLEEAEDRGVACEVWPHAGLSSLDAEAFAAAVGSGVEGRYFPDLRRLPETDRGVRATARWRVENGRDVVTVAVDPLDPDRPVRLPAYPHIYLLAEGDGVELPADKSAAEQKAQRANDDVWAVRYEFTLPKNWRDRAGLAGRGRVAVLVCSEELTLRNGRQVDRLQKAVEDVRVVGGEPARWVGVLRASAAEFDFPETPRGK